MLYLSQQQNCPASVNKRQTAPQMFQHMSTWSYALADFTEIRRMGPIHVSLLFNQSLSWQRSRLLTESKYISQKITLDFERALYPPVNLLHTIYTHHVLYTQVTKKHHDWKRTHLDLWGCEVQIAKMHLHTFDTWELGGRSNTRVCFGNQGNSGILISLCRCEI